MSALTNLFTSLANKIRSKTGGSDTYTPPEMVAAIDDVYDAGVAAGTPTLTGNASASDVLESKTFYNTSTTKQTGLMTNNGSVSQALDCGASYTVPAGYHNGSGTVTANSLASQTGVDSGKTAIDPSHVHSGYQGWVNGSKVSGTYSEPVINSLNPSNSSPQALMGKAYYRDSTSSATMQIGYAIAGYLDVTPSNSSPVSLSSGSIYKMGGAGKAVASVSDVTPSNSSPVSLSSGSIYKMGGAGFAISSYSSVTPSSSGASFSSGMVKMDGNGYAYSSRPSSGYNYGWNSSTLLWSNGSPTSSFTGKTITLSQAFTNFRYIRIVYNAATNKTTQASIIVTREDLQNSSWNDTTMPLVSFSGRNPNSTSQFTRRIIYSSATQLSISDAYQLAQNITNNSSTIPLYIYGLT